MGDRDPIQVAASDEQPDIVQQGSRPVFPSCERSIGVEWPLTGAGEISQEPGRRQLVTQISIPGSELHKRSGKGPRRESPASLAHQKLFHSGSSVESYLL